MHAVSRVLSTVSEVTGRIVAWLTLPMVVGTFVVVLLRYQFELGWIWMQEGVVWLHAVTFMLASAYTLNRDEHVRVDVFYRNMSARRRALVDLLGTLLFLAPMSVFVLVVSVDYVAVSWAIREGSREAGGLPYPFVPLLKSVIPATALLLLVQGAANALAAWQTLAGGRAGEADPGRGA